MPHVSIYLDDILVTSTSEAHHLKTLDEVINCLETAVVRLIDKRNKCASFLPSVEYLEHKISAKSLQPIDKKSEPLKRLQHQVICLN